MFADLCVRTEIISIFSKRKILVISVLLIFLKWDRKNKLYTDKILKLLLFEAQVQGLEESSVLGVPAL